jgi:hypothetical protein
LRELRIGSLDVEKAGPLVFWTLMYIIGGMIELSAYSNTDVFFELGSEVSLWAVGILFALSVSESTYSGAKLGRHVSQKPSGTGYEVDYDVTLTGEFGFTPKYFYLFLLGVAIWIATLLLGDHAIQCYSSTQSLTGIGMLVTLASMFLGGSLVVMAVRTVYEVDT